jgi:predicted GNAT family acetyltransferase
VTDPLARAVAFEETIRERCIDRREVLPWGVALFTESLPLVWELNLLRVDRPDGVTAGDLAAEAERRQGAARLRHRRVVVPDGAAGKDLAADFRALGWKVDRFLYMAHRRSATRTVSTGLVVEVERADLAPLRTRIAQEDERTSDPETIRELLATGERIAHATRARHFGVRRDGAVASSADLYSDGKTAQIEDVATVPERRGRGYASAVVSRALSEALAAGHDLVFLVADEDDWPKDLYAKLGFEAIGHKYAFLRPPS